MLGPACRRPKAAHIITLGEQNTEGGFLEEVVRPQLCTVVGEQAKKAVWAEWMGKLR